MKDICNLLQCVEQKLFILYFGIPLGANAKKILTWKPVIEKVERRLALWKTKTVLRASRLPLIKVVLNNLPKYYLS